ncbi:MAG: lipocalin-like domain-containing protein [Pseudomonadota bacterium]
MLARFIYISIAALTATVLSVAALSRPDLSPETVETSETGNILSALAELPGDGFAAPDPNWRLTLPGDHAPHDEARTESWQLHAHLRDESGEDVGFQFSILRFAIAETADKLPASAWALREVYRGHSILQDASDGTTRAEERFSRGMEALAGFDNAASVLRLDNWTLRFDVDGMTLSATSAGEVSIKLELQPAKSVLSLQPDGGAAPFAGYAYTRLDVEGTLVRGAGPEVVRGVAWYEHSWGELPVPGAGPVAWDRVQFQLEDGTDGTFLRSRRRDGRGAATVNGAFWDQQGNATALNEDQITMTPTDTWTANSAGATYPVAWRLQGPAFDLSITPVSETEDHGFAFPMWSGAVRVTGTRAGETVTGIGTLQLTGYEGQ